MLTTADWLLGSNSQSAAGLSTLGDIMKGQYLVFSPTQLRARMKALFVVYLFEPPTSLMKTFNLSQKYAIYQLQNYKVASTIVPFIQKVFAVIVVLFFFKHGLTPIGFESVVYEW